MMPSIIFHYFADAAMPPPFHAMPFRFSFAISYFRH
jgi:hypothetical protein